MVILRQYMYAHNTSICMKHEILIFLYMSFNMQQVTSEYSITSKNITYP